MAAEGLLSLAEGFAQEGCVLQAVKCLEAIVQSDTPFLPLIQATARVRLANLLLDHTDNPFKAKECLEQAQLLISDVPATLGLKLRLLSELGRYYMTTGEVSSQKVTPAPSGSPSRGAKVWGLGGAPHDSKFFWGKTGPPKPSRAAEAEAAAIERIKELKAFSMPLSPEHLAEAEKLIKGLTSENLRILGLYPKPQPHISPDIEKMPPKPRLRALQNLISSYEYNFTSEQFFNVRKDRPLGRIMDTAKKIMRDALPIKCVEAVFLGLYLTMSMEDLDRIPVGFKSEVAGKVYRHIVLVVKHRPSGKYGALGLSRRAELMYKDLEFGSMSAILTDYKEAYERWWHTVLKVRVGLPVEHNLYSSRPVCWRHCCLKLPNKEWDKLCTTLDDHAAKSHRLYAKWQMSGGKAKIKEGGEGKPVEEDGGAAKPSSVAAGSAMAAVRAYAAKKKKNLPPQRRGSAAGGGKGGKGGKGGGRGSSGAKAAGKSGGTAAAEATAAAEGEAGANDVVPEGGGAQEGGKEAGGAQGKQGGEKADSDDDDETDDDSEEESDEGDVGGDSDSEDENENGPPGGGASTAAPPLVMIPDDFPDDFAGWGRSTVL